MDKYIVLEAIGEGSFGRVFRGQDNRSGNIVALKFIPKRSKNYESYRELDSLRRECEIHKGLFHPNIVRMVDAFETDREVVAVSEYIPLQLYNLLEKYGPLPEDKVRSVACDLVSAIYYLHSKRILHRDIKPQNILLTLDWSAKLCDFGFSREMRIGTYVLTSVKGTPLYMAPEIMKGSPYDHTADLWSLGCILFELLTGKPPFCTTSMVKLIEMVQMDHINWPNNVSVECQSFLEGLLQRVASQRLTWPTLLEHPWVRTGVVVMNKRDNPFALTSPLSSSQQQIKNLQMMQLIRNTPAYPKVMKNVHQPNDDAGNKQGPNSISAAVTPADIHAPLLNRAIKSRHSQSTTFTKMRETKLDQKDVFEMKTFSPSTEIVQPAEPLFPSTLDVTAGVGSSVRKLSIVSLESGFKAEDVADITERHACSEANRKDSLINYLSSSIDSSRRGSKLLTENLQNLPNINEESVGNASSTLTKETLIDGNSVKIIEEEEWVRFIDKTLAEVLRGSFIVYKECSELIMITSPLKSLGCPMIVVDKIVTLLLIPFVAEQAVDDVETIYKVYLRCKVVSSLVFALERVVHCNSDELVNELDVGKRFLQTLKSLSSLLCYLVHSDEKFLFQFRDSIDKFSIYGALLTRDIHKDVTEKILAIITQLLRNNYDNAATVDEIFLSTPDVCDLLVELLNNNSNDVKASCCSLIGYSAAASCSFVDGLENQHNLFCDLINLQSHESEEVRDAALFADSCLQVFTHFLSENEP